MFSFFEEASKLLSNENINKVISTYQRDLSDFATQLSTTAAPIASALLPQVPPLNDELTDSETNSSVSMAAAARASAEDSLRKLRDSRDTFLREVTAEECQQATQLGSLSFDEFWNQQTIDSKTEATAALLESDERLRALMGEVVPTQISYELFWKRYWYRYHLHELDQERRKKLQQLQSRLKSSTAAAATAGSSGWDDDDDDEVVQKVASTQDTIDLKSWYEKFQNLVVQVEQAAEGAEAKQMLVRELQATYEEKLRAKDTEIAALKQQLAKLSSRSSGAASSSSQSLSIPVPDAAAAGDMSRTESWEVINKTPATPQSSQQQDTTAASAEEPVPTAAAAASSALKEAAENSKAEDYSEWD